MALEGVASPARQGAKAQLLQTVLKQGGAKSAAALRRWAREGRPYRGLVFTLEEVEAAIAAEVKPELTAAKPAPSTQPSAPEPEGVRAAQAEDGKGATAGLTATLRCEPWPPDFLPTSVAAALRVVGDAGVGGRDAGPPLPPGHSTITSSTCTDLLKSLYEGPKGARYPDLVLAVGPAVRIGAHKAILSGWSNFFQAKFASAFGDAGEAVLDLTSQSPDVVRAMVELMYLGRCEVLPAHLPELVVLADFWQAPLLAEAARKYWHMLPIVHQLEVLSNLDENSAVPQAMVGALVDSLSGSFNNATQHLQRGTASACWRLLGELHTWLQHTPSVPLGNLRGWLSLEEDELSIAVERFVLAAIKAADELTKQQLLSRRSLKTWLPEPMLRRIVQQLATLGAFNEGQVAFWVSWTLSGGLSCEMLLDLYEDLERKVDLQEPGDLQVFEGLQPAFGLALAEESLLNPSAGFWERHWHRGDNFGWVMRHAARVLGEAALRGRPVPPLPASCAAAALEAAFARAKPLALRVAGPEAVAGTYQAEAGAFRRRGEGPVLELRRTDRTFGGPTATVSRFDVVWKGLPVADYKKATSLWSIEDIHAVESEEMQPPLALLLTRSAPWERMVLRWWYGGEVFRPEPGLRVQVEAISEAEASCLKSSLGPWTAAFLRQVAEASDVLAVQNLCRAVQAEKAPAPVSSPLKPASSAAPPAPPEVCCDEWQKAAEIVRGAAKQLCQLLQDLQGDLSPAEAKHLLARKRRLESEDTFVAAVRRLEKPTAKDDLGDG
ncbi:unnamed protein product [Effrenium voratum]|uniref:BTB domain-containing protein n=1 Tax=Effrenium voratum TaxID=2562239 RepID=A0AA36NA79_9DINO|nr:unnamed protein product [Effrenium voratum]